MWSDFQIGYLADNQENTIITSWRPHELEITQHSFNKTVIATLNLADPDLINKIKAILKPKYQSY